MKMIFALGNFAEEYKNTRHNLGFMAVDHFININKLPKPSQKPKFMASISQLSYGGEKILLVFPQTFYNLTGNSAQKIKNFYKIGVEDILVIHDDLSLDFGKIKVRKDGSSGGNNGLKSLHEQIGSGFWQIKIGTKTDLLEKVGATDFVMSHFNKQEQEAITTDIMPITTGIIKDFLENKTKPDSIKFQQTK